MNTTALTSCLLSYRKTALAGVSVYCISQSTLASITTIVADRVLSYFMPSAKNNWFNSEKVIQDITTDTCITCYQILLIRSVVLLFFARNSFGIDNLSWNILSTVSISTMLSWMFHLCVLTPVAEEIFFRGFLQEKLEGIQNAFTETNKPFHKYLRIAISASVFALAHYHETNTSNKSLMYTALILGLATSTLKEETSDVTASIAIHSLYNLSTCLIILYLKRI